MESLLRPNGQAALYSAHTAYCVECAQSIFGWREVISYAVIIYSSLGMEEEAFTGMINIFGFNCARPAGHLSPQPASHYLRCAFRKAHRLIGDITQLDSPFILQFISTPASEVSGQTCFLAAAVSCPLKATSSSRKIAALFKIPDICIEIRLLGEKNKGDKQ